MSKWIYSLLIIVILLGVIKIGYSKYKTLERDYGYSIENFKAQQEELQGNNRMFKLTLAQLYASQDSITYELLEAKKELGIKDKRIKQLQYQSTTVSKSDTVVLTDTIFRDSAFKLDTIIGDKWVKAQLLLEYPNKIVVTPEVVLQRSVIVSTKRETIKPRKKFFIARWFQKKHTVVEIKSIERNPYVTKREERYIEIIK